MTTQPITCYGIFTEDGLDGIEHTKGSASKHSKDLTKMGFTPKTVVCYGIDAEAFLEEVGTVINTFGRMIHTKGIAVILKRYPTVTIVKG